MQKCKLCLTNHADKKGSHIVPHFLLKRIENIEGKTGRGYELGFTIEEFHTSTHFGQSVLPKKLEETYGEISEEDIDRNVHPHVVDNYFCSPCEERLAVIESEYAKTLSSSGEGDFETGANGALGILFWGSVFWRMSIGGKSGITLEASSQEFLRQMLDANLKQSLSEISPKLDHKIYDQKLVSYKLLRCCNYSPAQATYLVLRPEFDEPYSLLIDEFVVCISFDGSYQAIETIDFFGLNEEIRLARPNIGEEKELAHHISAEKLEQAGIALIDHMKTLRVTHINNFFDQVLAFLQGKGVFMPISFKREVLAEITSVEKKLGRKYTVEDLNSSTLKIVQKYMGNP